MHLRTLLRAQLDTADLVMQRYLGDLSDADLLVRPVPTANHLAWQLGHLIVNEHRLLVSLDPAEAELLPPGFGERHGKDRAAPGIDDGFEPKARYLELHRAVRSALLRVIDGLEDPRFDDPAPEWMRSYAPTIAHALGSQATHQMLHLGQAAVLRRALGKPVVL